MNQGHISDLKKFYPEVERIRNLKKVICDDPHKLDELPIAIRFIRCLNKTGSIGKLLFR